MFLLSTKRVNRTVQTLHYPRMPDPAWNQIPTHHKSTTSVHTRAFVPHRLVQRRPCIAPTLRGRCIRGTSFRLLFRQGQCLQGVGMSGAFTGNNKSRAMSAAGGTPIRTFEKSECHIRVSRQMDTREREATVGGQMETRLETSFDSKRLPHTYPWIVASERFVRICHALPAVVELHSRDCARHRS